MNERLTMLVLESAILNNYKIKGFEHMDVDKLKLFFFPEDGKLTPVAILITKLYQLVPVTSFGEKWNICTSAMTLNTLKQLFFHELYDNMNVFTHSKSNFSMKLVHIAKELADNHKMYFTCASNDLENYVVTVTIEHPDKESKVIGKETFTLDDVTFDRLFEKVNDCGHKVWAKYINWQPYFKIKD